MKDPFEHDELTLVFLPRAAPGFAIAWVAVALALVVVAIVLAAWR